MNRYAVKLSQEKAEEMRARYRAGERVASLARAFGVSWANAKHVVVGDTWTGEPRKPVKVSDETVRAIKQHIAAGEKSDWIAFEYGVSPSYVRYIRVGRVRAAVA